MSEEYLNIEKDCLDTLLRLNIKEDELNDKPLLDTTINELDGALDRYNVELYTLIDRKDNILSLLKDNNIAGLEELLISLKETKISIFKTKENINYCINKINSYKSFIMEA